jgi:glycosyltransferase involved in cell wall biosynthesis
MRILLVNYEYPPLGGGGGILTQSLARNLARIAEVVVLASGTKDLPRETISDGVRVVRVRVVGRTRRQQASPVSLAAFVPSARIAGRRRLGAWSPDVVHTFFAIPSGPAGAAASRHYRAPHVLTVIGADIHDPSRRFSPDGFAPLRAIVRNVVRGATAVAAISADVAGRTQALTGRSGMKVIPCGVDPRPLPAPSRAALGWEPDEFVIVTTARLVPRKAVHRLITAMVSLPPRCRLEIIGDGPQRETLEALARTTGRRIVFAGDIDDTARDLRLMSADAFCQPSLHEGFGIAILEAMGCGIPVVATDSGGPRDFVSDGVNGFLVPPADASVFAARLGELAGDPARRARMGKAAASTAGKLTAAAMTDKYLQLYASVE